MGGQGGRTPSPHSIASSLGGPTHRNYLQAADTHCYRNGLFARLGMPHRFVAQITVETFGLRGVCNVYLYVYLNVCWYLLCVFLVYTVFVYVFVCVCLLCECVASSLPQPYLNPNHNPNLHI